LQSKIHWKAEVCGWLLVMEGWHAEAPAAVRLAPSASGIPC